MLDEGNQVNLHSNKNCSTCDWGDLGIFLVTGLSDRAINRYDANAVEKIVDYCVNNAVCLEGDIWELATLLHVLDGTGKRRHFDRPGPIS